MPLPAQMLRRIHTLPLSSALAPRALSKQLPLRARRPVYSSAHSTRPRRTLSSSAASHCRPLERAASEFCSYYGWGLPFFLDHSPLRG